MSLSVDEKKAWSSKIIKGSQQDAGGVRALTPPPSLDNIARDGEDAGVTSADRLHQLARAEAEHVLQTAARRADEMLQEAQEEAENIRTAAEESGFTEGRRRGMVEAQQQLQQSLEQLQDWRQQIRRRQDKQMEELAEQLTDLVVHLVEKAIGRTLQQQQEWVLQMVTEALKQYSEISDVTLTVCPGDLPAFLKRRDDLQRHIPPRADLLLNTADGLDPGEFRLQADEGAFDVTAEDLSESLRRVLQKDYHREVGADESDG